MALYDTKDHILSIHPLPSGELWRKAFACFNLCCTVWLQPITAMSRDESGLELENLEKHFIESQECLDDKLKLIQLTALEQNERPHIASWRGSWKKKLSPIPCWHLASWATGYTLSFPFPFFFISATKEECNWFLV